MEIRKVGVVGCGLMGGGIAQICAQSGFETVVREVSPELLDQGLRRIERILLNLLQPTLVWLVRKQSVAWTPRSLALRLR